MCSRFWACVPCTSCWRRWPTSSTCLNYGLAVILVFIGTKMCLIDLYKIPVGVSLGVVVGILAVTMLLSVRTANVPAKGQKA